MINVIRKRILRYFHIYLLTLYSTSGSVKYADNFSIAELWRKNVFFAYFYSWQTHSLLFMHNVLLFKKINHNCSTPEFELFSYQGKTFLKNNGKKSLIR